MTAFVIHRGMEISDPVFCSLGEVGMHFTLLSHCCDAEYRGKLPKYRFHRRISFNTFVKKLTSIFRKLHRNRDVTLDEAHNHKHSKNNFNSSHCKQLNLTEVLRVSRAL